MDFKVVNNVAMRQTHQINVKKLQFCQKILEFVGFLLTNIGMNLQT